MKATIRTAIIFFLFTIHINGQENHGMNFSVFNDADVLDNAKATSNEAKQIEILSHYFKSKAEIDTFNAKYVFTLPNPIFDNSVIPLAENANIQSSLSTILSKGPEALGTFVANRFKQEINIAFLSKFREDLDNIPYLKFFFHTSYDVLKQSDPYNYPVFINTLREAFDTDIQTIHERSPEIINQLDIKDDRIKSRLILAVSLMNVRNINSIPSLVNNLSDSSTTTSDIYFKEIKSLALAINIFKKEGTGTASFLSGSDLAKITGVNVQFRDMYIALLVRQNEKIIRDLNINVNSVKNLNSFIKEFASSYDAIGKQINTIESHTATGTLTLADTQAALTVTINSFGNIITILENNKIIGDQVALKKSIQAGKEINAVFGFITSKKYGLALIHLTTFIIDMDSANTLDPEQEVKVKKYTAFIANCLDASSKEDLVTALETSANPVGSYRIKRNSTFNIALNAYAGGFAGSNFHKDNATVFGFTAPVGLYLGWGNIGKKKADLDKDTGKSFGFFIPIVDVGAVTAFRIKDSETEMADVTWSNVFAPGIYATYGFKKCPISLNAGGQVGPELKKVNSDGTLEFVKKEWYWRFGVVVDISIFDFLITQNAYKLDKK